MSTVLGESLRVWWPEVFLTGGALLVMLAGPWVRRGRPLFWCAWLALLAAGAALWRAPSASTDPFFGLIVCDGFSLVFRWIVWASTALIVLLISASARDAGDKRQGEYLGLVLLAAVGLMLMAEANHLLIAYLAMELVSLSSYLLVGFRDDRRSAEAALKYLLFGALSSGLMLFGLSWLYGLTGALGFQELTRSLAGLSGEMTGALLVAAAFLFAGLAFKMSMVPFHFWTPDAYEGAPIAVTAMLSVGPKAAGFALFIRVLGALAPAWAEVAPVLLALTVVTMTLGNVVALLQNNVKRLLAYSTIAQVGYVLIGVVVGTPAGREALFVYLVAYLFMNLGAFACVMAVFNATGSEALDAFKGLARRSPVLALCATLFLLSLAGIPPLVGFLGKFLLFGAAVESQQTWLAIAGLANSAIALYYYVNLIRLMYVAEPPSVAPVRVSHPLRLALGVCAAGTVGLGLWPSALLRWLSGIA